MNDKYLKIIHKDLLLEDLEVIKSDLEQSDYELVLKFINDSKNEFLNVISGDLDTIIDLQLLELSCLDFEVFLEDMECNLDSFHFFSVLKKFVKNGNVSFVTPLTEAVYQPINEFLEEYEKQTGINAEDNDYEVKDVLNALSELLNERCFDMNKSDIEINEQTLDYDNYTITGEK